MHNMKKEELDAVLDAENGAMKALADAKKYSKIRFIGITGHSPQLLVEAVKTGIFDSVQVPHNIIDTGCEKELVGICKQLNIPVIAMKPVGGGALKEVASLNLRYVLTRGSTIAVPGIDKTEYVDMNLSILPKIDPLANREYELLTKARDRWQGNFCRRCGYCMPCPHGLNIPFLLLLKAYWERYDLKKWVRERLEPLQKKYDDCKKCGECTAKCPYSLPVKDMMESSTIWSETLKGMPVA
jgi:predicted aldo/keto reductase-like oxidoreductase